MLLSNPLKEDRQVVVVVKLVDCHFPLNYVLHPMADGNREVTAVVEPAEFGPVHVSGTSGVGKGISRLRFGGRLVQREISTPDPPSLVQV